MACSGSRCRRGCGPSARGRARSRGSGARPAPRTGAPRRTRRRGRSKRSASSRITASSATSSSRSLPDSSRDRSSRSPTILDRRTASRSSCAANRGITAGSSTAAVRIVSAAAWIVAAGVFSSCEALATKSRRTCSSRRASVTSRIVRRRPAVGHRDGDASQPARRRAHLGVGRDDLAPRGRPPSGADGTPGGATSPPTPVRLRSAPRAPGCGRRWRLRRRRALRRPASPSARRPSGDARRRRHGAPPRASAVHVAGRFGARAGASPPERGRRRRGRRRQRARTPDVHLAASLGRRRSGRSTARSHPRWRSPSVHTGVLGRSRPVSSVAARETRPNAKEGLDAQAQQALGFGGPVRGSVDRGGRVRRRRRHRRGHAGDGATAPEDLSGSLNISGSSTVEPITSLVAEKFQGANPGVTVAVDGPGTSDGFELFCNGETDISDASRPIDEEEIAACEANGITPIELEVALDALSVIGHPANPVDVPARSATSTRCSVPSPTTSTAGPTRTPSRRRSAAPAACRISRSRSSRPARSPGPTGRSSTSSGRTTRPRSGASPRMRPAACGRATTRSARTTT